MRKKDISHAKLLVTVRSPKGTNEIFTESIFDTRTNKCWTQEQIEERGCTKFSGLDDLKETLNWNLNGDSRRYYFKWTVTTKDASIGTAYITD